MGHHIVHADLSCRNILVHFLNSEPKNIVIKIIEFGLSVVLPEDSESECRRQPRAVRWCAPETIAKSKLSLKSDVWAYGTTLWELFSHGAVPWGSIEKRSDVADRLLALAQDACDFDATIEFPPP